MLNRCYYIIYFIKTLTYISEEVQEFYQNIGEGCYEIDDIIAFIQHILDVYFVPIKITYNNEKRGLI